MKDYEGEISLGGKHIFVVVHRQRRGAGGSCLDESTLFNPAVSAQNSVFLQLRNLAQVLSRTLSTFEC